MRIVDKIIRGIRRFVLTCIQRPRVVLYRCISTNSIKGTPRCFQPVQSVGVGTISVENDVNIGYYPSPFYLSTYAYLEARNVSASISIGDGTRLNNNFCAIAEHTSIEIGRNCLIGTNVEILDSDFHGIKVEQRQMSRPEWARPVSIGDHVFIGSNVKIMKGVTIGPGAVIAHSSVVSNDVPAGMIVAGNPAKIIRTIGQNE